MRSKPVRKYSQPKYPTRLEIAARPDLLQRHQPPAWRKWPELTGAAGLFLLADTALLSAADNSPERSKNPAQTNAVAIVAPVFQHGEGRGATGCIVMSPPVFLSEEEALQVIREEMATIGVELGTNQTTLAGVTVERGVFSAPANPSGATNRTKPAGFTFEIKKEPFKADVADPKKKVFVEFLSERDAKQWDWERVKEEQAARGTNSEFLVFSSVQSYELTKTAGYVAERVRRQATNKVYFGTFYDPIAKSLEIREQLPGLLAEKDSPGSPPPPGPWAGAKADSRRLLRLQVQDFLKWLQAQGVI
jgi:hypothetical protein